MRMKWLAVVGFLAAIVSGQAVAQTPAFDTKAKQIYLVDAETGTVLFSRDEDAPVPPASLAKLMAMEVVFEALDRGDLTSETSFEVSEHAWRTGGAPPALQRCSPRSNPGSALRISSRAQRCNSPTMRAFLLREWAGSEAALPN